MVTETELSKGDPAKGQQQLKSLLKKPGSHRANGKSVIFNETRNEFFDADYIILIREECGGDYEEDEDYEGGDGVCTCGHQEMVRVRCCEPGCDCYYDDEEEEEEQEEEERQQSRPQQQRLGGGGKWAAPPPEFGDAVTLSPPEGYKDMEGLRQRPVAPVCRECSQECHDHQDLGGRQDEAPVENDKICESSDQDEKETTDQSQQTTPTSPPCTGGQGPMAMDPMESKASSPAMNRGSPISGILKGGRLWKQTSFEGVQTVKPAEEEVPKSTEPPNSQEDDNKQRSVRFNDASVRERCCDGAPEPASGESKQSLSPEVVEMMLTFKLGNHVLVSNNSLKPNSAVRQLFPCTAAGGNATGTENSQPHQYLVTAESLRAFEEANRSSLPLLVANGEADESIRRAIEHNTLRRSLIKYEPRRRCQRKPDTSLEERIRQLTCDVDAPVADQEPHEQTYPTQVQVQHQERVSPTGEEARPAEVKSFSPSSSSSSSSGSTYRRITDLFVRRQDDTRNSNRERGRREFLSTLAPLTGCVGGSGGRVEQLHRRVAGDRASVGTEYSLEDIEDALHQEDGQRRPQVVAPDVLTGTPSGGVGSDAGDELAAFIQEDAARIERIKKKYQSGKKKDEDDEHNDYGFNHRPNVRGIKAKPETDPVQSRISWPYYSEAGLVDNTRTRNMNQAYPYQETCRVGVNANQQPMPVPVACHQGYHGKGRPQSPPPLEISRQYHQTMVYVPYQHLEQPIYQYQRVDNRRYLDQGFYMPHPNYVTVKPVPVPVPVKTQYPGPCVSRSESPALSEARATQTPAIAPVGSGIYATNKARQYRTTTTTTTLWQNHECTSYVTRGLRIPYPTGMAPDTLSLCSDNDSVAGGYTQASSLRGSPTRYTERGVPEGAASVSPQDGLTQPTATSPQNAPPSVAPRPLFYAMNV